MIISNHDKAAVLIQALPYIQKYTGKTVVIKYGGNAMVNEDLKEAVISDIVLLSLVGINTVLVHGGGPEISQMLKKIGSAARPEIEDLLQGKANLQLWVKVKKDWRDSDFLLKNFGYHPKDASGGE